MQGKEWSPSWALLAVSREWDSQEPHASQSVPGGEPGARSKPCGGLTQAAMGLWDAARASQAAPKPQPRMTMAMGHWHWHWPGKSGTRFAPLPAPWSPWPEPQCPPRSPDPPRPPWFLRLASPPLSWTSSWRQQASSSLLGRGDRLLRSPRVHVVANARRLCCARSAGQLLQEREVSCCKF